MNDRLRSETISQNIRFASTWKLSFRFYKNEGKYQKVVQCSLLFALALCIFTAPSLAQTPTWSREVQNLSISYDECKSRARRALEAEGYTIENQGGDNNRDYYFADYKDIHTAIIACNSSPDGKIWVNVFVASCLSTRNGNVPGAERVKLQERMDRPSTDGGQNSNLVGDWIYRDGSFSDTHIFYANGVVGSPSNSSVTATWKIEGNELVVRWSHGWINQYRLPVVSGQLSGTGIGPSGERRAITLSRQ